MADEIKEESTTIVKPAEHAEKGFLGIDFNNPLAIGVTAIIGVGIGYFGINFAKNLLFNQAPPQQQLPPPANITIPTPAQMRQNQRQIAIDQRLPNPEEAYIEQLRMNQTLEENNRSLQKYNIRGDSYYDQMYNQPPLKRQQPMPQALSEDEEVIEIIDEHPLPVPKQEREYEIPRPQPQVRQYTQPPPQRYAPTQQQQQQATPPPPPPPETAVEEVGDINIDPSKIPPEFTNVGNRPEPFENIDTSGLDMNMEVDEATIRQWEMDAAAS